jgi:putative beta-lysine N-acetyltransferase
MKSILTHDKASNRIYLMHLHQDDFPKIINYMEDLSHEFSYTKIFAKVSSLFAPLFFNAGYIIEAAIPRFFKGEQDVLFLAKYKSSERQIPEYDSFEVFQNMLVNVPSVNKMQLDNDFSIRKLTIDDVSSMIVVFKQVFETYPFPIFEPLFLTESIQENKTQYFGISCEGNLIAVSSAECDNAEQNAEMTDFAVLPRYRGKRFASHLLSYMENELFKSNFKTFYTISRLKSLSMNKTFYNSGYKYSGTLIKNTQISGNIESMNVLYKNL